MGKYEQAYDEFVAKYDLNLNIQTEYDGANRLASIDDFAMDTSPERKAQNVYISTLSSALTDYISKKVKIEPKKNYDLANIDIGGFIAEFDKVIDAIRSDEAEKEKTEYTHRKFEGLPIDRVANEAWARVAPGFNKPLHEIWAGQIRKGSLSIEQMQKITSSSTRLLDDMTGPNRNYNSAANKDLADVVMIKNAMAEAINKRSWTSWLNPFNWGPNMRENAYLKELNGKINTYRENNFPVDNVVPAMYAGNMLEGALSELQNTYGVRYQPTQNTATAVKSGKTVVQQNIKAPSVKLTSMDEALAHYNENNMQENLRAEIEGIFANVNHPFKKFLLPGMPDKLKQEIMPHWINFEKATTNQAKEENIKRESITLLKMLDVNLYGITSNMDPKDRIVALQKVANVFMRNFSPATSDVKYYKYLDNYFAQNAPLKEIQNIIGDEADVNAVMEGACKELGVEKTKVYLPELSNNKDELKNSDKIEEIGSLSNEKTID